MIDLMFESPDRALTFRLDQKLIAEERNWCRVGPFEMSLARGEAIELLFPDERSLTAVMEILTLRDMNWIGALTLGDIDVHGAGVVPAEKRPWVFSEPLIHDDSLTGIVLERVAIKHGFARPGETGSLRRLAEQFDLEGSLETRVGRLTSVERQWLHCALLYVIRPSIVLIDGRDPLYPAVRARASAVFNRLVDSTTFVVLKLIGSNKWGGLATVRSHPPVQSIPYEWGHGYRESGARAVAGRSESREALRSGQLL